MLDVSLTRGKSRFCDGFSRRDFLRIGALAPFGLALPDLLASQKSLAAVPGAKSPRAKSVILVYLGGGISHHDTFDPKPGAPEEIRGKYKPISTSVPGLQFTELLPRLAKLADKFALVRSGCHENDNHEIATNWVLSGRFGSGFGDYPAIGAVVAEETGFAGIVPPYVSIPKNPAFTWELGRSAYLGGRFESFRAGDPNEKNYKVRDLALAQPMAAPRLERRRTLLEAVDTLSASVKGNDQIATYDEFQTHAAEMVLSDKAQSAFDIDKEQAKLRDEYGRNTFGQSCLLARRLVESGTRFVTVTYGGWDHHAKIWDGLEKKTPELDQGLAALFRDMEDRGSLRETLVLVMGEFGRTPKVNKDAGRDHWMHAGSMLFAGAGVRGGKVIGATDKQGAFVTDRPVRPADVAWTVYEALGIDPKKQLRTPEGRPVEILDLGAPVHELYS
jgi:hypothetical protein